MTLWIWYFMGSFRFILKFNVVRHFYYCNRIEKFNCDANDGHDNIDTIEKKKAYSVSFENVWVKLNYDPLSIIWQKAINFHLVELKASSYSK